MVALDLRALTAGCFLHMRTRLVSIAAKRRGCNAADRLKSLPRTLPPSIKAAGPERQDGEQNRGGSLRTRGQPTLCAAASLADRRISEASDRSGWPPMGVVSVLFALAAAAIVAVWGWLGATVANAAVAAGAGREAPLRLLRAVSRGSEPVRARISRSIRGRSRKIWRSSSRSPTACAPIRPITGSTRSPKSPSATA